MMCRLTFYVPYRIVVACTDGTRYTTILLPWGLTYVKFIWKTFNVGGINIGFDIQRLRSRKGKDARVMYRLPSNAWCFELRS
ncbi:hypothetical protein KC19_VG249000 [Ceratodon purpureus]|uniref:Uncharacterized protein n=1 Tax=Ceratodon purpureus TaxID=3225 RepID=A0A8T0HU53_CERPU|nr:hypothetical protein KC19_VG249000 [Ceratodon purpureus]